ncbi:hypothetical protein DOY81_006185, partial [Sarcophaga bullata]
KFFLIAFAVLAVVAADVSHLPSNEYLPPVQEAAPVEVAAVQQVVVEEAAPAHELADDGYRYKTNRRVVYRRNRRDVSNEYLPPVQESAPVAEEPITVNVVVEEAAPAHELAADGYRYKTNRRVVYRRNRRDVSNEYLPPVQEAAPVEVAPVQQAVVEEAAPAHELAADGYRYKTNRRVVYRRNRRDVSNEYLPPVQEAAPVEVAPVQQAVVEEAAPAHELAVDGYRYKTNRRVVYRRNRRDVSNEYLPPVQEAAPVEVAPVQQVVVEEAAPAHELAVDGYRYKTNRRVVYRRNRRDASHVAAYEYQAPVEEAAPVAEPTNEYLPPVSASVEAAPAHELAVDGYRYKTNRRVVYRRNRRDASHVAAYEYQAPVEEAAPVAEPTNEYLPPVSASIEVAPAHELADDGYRYKTNRRVVYRRNRRDVSHLPSNEYLPPVQEAAPVAVPTNEYLPPVSASVEATPAHELADDGYRYKTHRRVVVHRRH